jgi:hypothetical protein
MTLVQSWIDSLQLLEPKNLQPFAMVMLKSIIEAYKLMFKYFWWLIALQLICFIPPFLSIGSFFMAIGLQQLLFCIVCVIARPSGVKKDFAYFKSQLYSFVYFIPLLLVSSSIESSFASIGGKFLPFSAWTVFLILFFLDSEKNLKSFFLSVWYALKMIVFNFPLMLCVHVVIWLSTAVIFSIVNLIMIGTVAFGMSIGSPIGSLFYVGLVYSIIMILLLPISICIYANIYIKKLHDQFDLYFKPAQ